MIMTIDNEEVLCDKELTIKEEMLNTSSTILNNCFPKSWETDKDYVSRFYFPKDYAKCKIVKDDNLLFCGVVKNTGKISLNPRYPHYCNLQILDFKSFLSEGETLDFVINNKTIEQTIQIIIDAVSDYGFVLGNIELKNPEEIIGTYSTLNKTPYDVFQYIADITQSKWTTRVIDENTIAIDFYDPELMPRALDIEYTKEYFEENNIIDISFSYSTNDYRNKQVMTSDEIIGSTTQSQELIANGFDKTYIVEQKIGEIKSIKVNGIEKEFATTGDKELGITADFYYSIGGTTIESENILTTGSDIDITYTPIIQGRQVIINSDEVSRINQSTGRKGIVSRYENRSDAITSHELQKIGESYIKYKGSAEIKLTVKTHNKDLYNIGEVVKFHAPLEELTTEYMVKTKTTNYIMTTGDIFYTYELSSSFNSENAINYFDNQRAKNSGNIGEGEYISRNIDIENTANIIFYDFNIEEIEVEQNNILDAIIEAPFTK